jgi:hypothetical protein
MTPEEASTMSISAHCGSCNRKLLLAQLRWPSDGFRCPFCGSAFAPGYAMAAPDVSARLMVAHSSLVTALTDLEALTRGRLQLDRDTVLDPVTTALPPAKQPRLARGRPHWWARHASPAARTATPQR